MELTPFDWFKIISSVGAFLAGSAVWIWGRDRATSISSAVADRDLLHLRHQLEGIEKRLDSAGQKQSDLGDRIQALMLRHAHMEEQVKEHTRVLGEYRLGRRKYDPLIEEGS